MATLILYRRKEAEVRIVNADDYLVGSTKEQVIVSFVKAYEKVLKHSSNDCNVILECTYLTTGQVKQFKRLATENYLSLLLLGVDNKVLIEHNLPIDLSAKKIISRVYSNNWCS